MQIRSPFWAKDMAWIALGLSFGEFSDLVLHTSESLGFRYLGFRVFVFGVRVRQVNFPCAAIHYSVSLPSCDTRSRKGKLILFVEHCPLGGSYVRMLCDRILADSGVNFALAVMPKGVEALDNYEHFACRTGANSHGLTLGVRDTWFYTLVRHLGFSSASKARV